MYINTETLEYPISEFEIRNRFPNISFSANNFEPPDPYVSVKEVEPPSNLTRIQRTILGVPKLVKGEWIQTWEVVEISKEEQDASFIIAIDLQRGHRNGLLQRSDWTQLIDSPLSEAKKQEWATYRQTLRDFDYKTDPFNLTWPVPPT